MSQNNTNISAVVIAKNEEDRIGRCLRSLSWADEVWVIDNGSRDRTKEIAKLLGAKVVEVAGNDFSRLRTIGNEKANGKWILYVDADETVPAALRSEILEKTISSSPVAFYIRRKNHYLGQPWPYTDKMQRLFLKRAFIGWRGPVHESAQVNGSIGTLLSPLEHDTHRTLEEMVEKTNQWSEIEAQLRFDHGHPGITWWRLFRVMATEFFQSYFNDGGWRAGTEGIIEGIYQAFSMFVTYAKLWEMQKKVQSVK